MTMCEFHPDSFLAQLDPATRASLERIGTEQSYRSRASLFYQGEPSRHVLLITHGWVKVTSTSRNGEEVLLALRGPGDILGELSAVDGRSRSGTAEVLIDLTAQVVAGDRFARLLTQNPAVAMALLKHISRNLRQADRQRLEYVSTSSSARLAALVLKLAAEHGARSATGIVIQLPLTQREMATAAATSREMVARTLRTLRERDIIRTNRRQIVVVRPEVLRSLCGTPSSEP